MSVPQAIFIDVKTQLIVMLGRIFSGKMNFENLYV